MKFLIDFWLKLKGGAPESHGESAPETQAESYSLTMTLLPYLLVTGIASISIALLIVKFMPAGNLPMLGGSEIVSFDIVKYANAQRAVASKFLGKDGAEEAAPMLMEVSRRTREVVEEIAGPGTIVVVRQALIFGEYRDITDEVLTALGLPTDVPTQDPATYAMDFAPTMLSSERIQKQRTPPAKSEPSKETSPKILP